MYVHYVAATLATIAVLLPREKDFDYNCRKRISLLPHNRREIRGLSGRLKASYARLRVVQLFYHEVVMGIDNERAVNLGDLGEIWLSLLGQTVCSFGCLLTRRFRYKLLRKAIRHYMCIKKQSYGMCAVPGTPECIVRLRDLL